MKRAIVAALACGIFASGVLAQAPAEPIKIKNVEYKKLGTREATEKRMLDLLNPSSAHWGKWYMLTPFPHDRKKGPKLADAAPPEEELSKMKAGGPGPCSATPSRPPGCSSP